MITLRATLHPIDCVLLEDGWTVNDQTGLWSKTWSITLGESRLPIWAIPFRGFSIIDHQMVAFYFDGTRYITDEDLDGFVRDLLEARGARARLLLALAGAERSQGQRARARLMRALRECLVAEALA